ncbi:unnamed protein product, partial [Linum tenue]
MSLHLFLNWPCVLEIVYTQKYSPLYVYTTLMPEAANIPGSRFPFSHAANHHCGGGSKVTGDHSSCYLSLYT